MVIHTYTQVMFWLTQLIIKLPKLTHRIIRISHPILKDPNTLPMELFMLDIASQGKTGMDECIPVSKELLKRLNRFDEFTKKSQWLSKNGSLNYDELCLFQDVQLPWVLRFQNSVSMMEIEIPKNISKCLPTNLINWWMTKACWCDYLLKVWTAILLHDILIWNLKKSKLRWICQQSLQDSMSLIVSW